MLVAGLRHQRFERVGRAAAPVHDAFELAGERQCLLHLIGQAVIAEPEPDFRFRDRVGDLLRAQQRHGRDHDAAGLDDGEIGRHHHRAVGAAQQHAVTGNEAEVARQHVGDAVHPLGQLRVAQALRRRNQARPVAMAGRDPAVEQVDRAVDAIGIFQLRQVEQEVRPLRARGQVVAREAVEMRRRGHGCRSSPKSIWVTPLPTRWFSLTRLIPPRVPAAADGSSTARARSRSSAPRSRLHRCAAPGSRGKAPRP